MTNKQKLFADDYIATLGRNASESARKVGYSEETAKLATKWLSPPTPKNSNKEFKPELYEYIHERLDPIMKGKEDESIATRDELLRYLTKGLRQELVEEAVVVCGDGDGCSSPRTIEKKISIKDSNDCAKVLAKFFGMDIANINANVGMTVNIVDDLE